MNEVAQAIGYTVMSIACLFAVMWIVRFVRSAILAFIITRCWKEEHLHYQGKCVPKCRYCVIDREREERYRVLSSAETQ